MRTSSLVKIKSLPIYVGVIAPLLVMVIGIVFINQARQLTSSANSDKQPVQVKASNISGQSLTISWTTNKPAVGYIVYGSDSNLLDQTAKDVRDLASKTGESYLNHFVTIENLSPESNLYYRIVSSGVVFDNNGQPYQLKTAAKINPIDSDISQGRIINSDNSPAAGVLVYVTLANTSPMSGITDEAGNWMVPLSTALSSDLKTIANYDRVSQVIDLVAILGNLSSSVTLTTRNDNPTPDITLGQNYSFVNTSSANKEEGNNGQTSGNNGQGYNMAGTEQPTEGDLTITYPSASEKIGSQQPEFFGFGPPGEKLDIIVHSDNPINASTVVSNDRSWRWSPSSPLTPGEHTITVSYTDKDGFVKKITKNFFITAAQAAENNYLPSFTATGSGSVATMTPTQIPTAPPLLTPTATPFSSVITPTVTGMTTPTVTGNPTGTITPTPTPMVTQSVTTTPTATVTPAERFSVPENHTTVPTSGNWVTTAVLGGVGLLTVIVGLAYLLF